MIEIPDLGEGFHAMWEELLRLAENPPAPWTLIGAHMVALHGWKTGRRQPRVSRDADILVNAHVVSNGTERVSEALLSRGFSLDGVSPEGLGHRFVNGQLRFDILRPDGVGSRTGLFTSSGARTVEVPGGTQALQRTELVAIRAGAISGKVPVPKLLGAILVKVRAIAVDEQPEAQRGENSRAANGGVRSDPSGARTDGFLTAPVEVRMLREGKEEKSLRYRILITEDEVGEFVAECPSLPGCISQGKTRELAIENIQDAIKGHRESLKKHGDPIPPSIGEEIVEVNV